MGKYSKISKLSDALKDLSLYVRIEKCKPIRFSVNYSASKPRAYIVEGFNEDMNEKVILIDSTDKFGESGVILDSYDALRNFLDEIKANHGNLDIYCITTYGITAALDNLSIEIDPSGVSSMILW